MAKEKSLSGQRENNDFLLVIAFSITTFKDGIHISGQRWDTPSVPHRHRSVLSGDASLP
jgi:hypothetical protein